LPLRLQPSIAPRSAHNLPPIRQGRPQTSTRNGPARGRPRRKDACLDCHPAPWRWPAPAG